MENHSDRRKKRNTVLIPATTRMDLGNMWSDRSLIQKTTHCTYYLYEVPGADQSTRQVKYISVRVGGYAGMKNGQCWLPGYRKYSKFISWWLHNSVNILRMLNYILSANFMVHELYLSKDVKNDLT